MKRELRKRMENGIAYLVELRKNEERHIRYFFCSVTPGEFDKSLDERIDAMEDIVEIINRFSGWSALRKQLTIEADSLNPYREETQTRSLARRLSAALALRMMDDIESHRQLTLPL